MPTIIRFAVVLGAVLALAQPGLAAAHGAGHTVVDRVAGNALAVEFALPGGEPLADAQVLVFAPGADAKAWLQSRTDRLGRVAFLPDRPGTWRLELADDRGHAATAAVEVTADQAVPAEPIWRRWLLRLSLLANFVAVGLLLHGWFGRSGRGPAGAHDHGHGPGYDHDHDHDHGHHRHGHGHVHEPIRT